MCVCVCVCARVCDMYIYTYLHLHVHSSLSLFLSLSLSLSLSLAQVCSAPLAEHWQTLLVPQIGPTSLLPTIATMRFSFTFFSITCVLGWVCERETRARQRQVCVCVCVRERQREWETERRGSAWVGACFHTLSLTCVHTLSLTKTYTQTHKHRSFRASFAQWIFMKTIPVCVCVYTGLCVYRFPGFAMDPMEIYADGTVCL
jgi:hypothetical protein